MTSRHGTGLRALLLVAVVACGASPALEAPTHTPPPRPTSACEGARERLAGLERDGRVERLLAATASPAAECPALALHVRALHASAASALGACEEATAAALEVSRAADAATDDRARAQAAVASCTSVGDGEAALAEAIASKEKGDAAAARRLFDRAARAFTERSGRRLSLETTSSPNTSMYPRALFSSDGRWAVGAVGRRLTIVDTAARRRVLSFECDDSSSAAFGEGFVAVHGCDGAPGEDVPMLRPTHPRLLVFSLPTPLPVDTGSLKNARTIAAAGSLLAVADEGEVTLFDVVKRTTSWRARIPVARGDVGILSLAFDPRASRLAVRDSSGRLTILATADGRVVRTLAVQKGVDGTRFVFSPDGELLVELTMAGPAALWSVATGAKRSLTGSGSLKADNVTFSRNGRQATFWGGDRVSTLDVVSAKWLEERTLRDHSTVLSVVEANDRWFLLEQQVNGDVDRVELATGARHPLRRHQDKAWRSVAGALSPDASRWAFIVGDEYFEGNPVHVGSTSGHEATYPSHLEVMKPRAAALSDEATLLAVARAADVFLVDLPSGRIRRRFPVVDPASLAFSPGQDALAIVTSGGVEVYETRTGNLRFRVSDMYRPAIAWRADALAATVSDGPVQIFDAMTGRGVMTIPLPASTNATALAFDRDGTLLLDTYGGVFGIGLGEPNAAWSPRALKEGLRLARCPKESVKLPEWMRRDLRQIVSVSADCRVALVDRDHQLFLRRLPEGDPVVLLELVHGRDDFFFRSGTTVRDAEADSVGGRKLLLTDGTTARAAMGEGDVYPRDAVQLVGSQARDLVTCRIGPRVFPTEVCEERLFAPELVERFLAP